MDQNQAVRSTPTRAMEVSELETALRLHEDALADIASRLGVALSIEVPTMASRVFDALDALLDKAPVKMERHPLPEAIYQIASNCTPSGWSDVSKDKYDAHTLTKRRKKRIVFTSPVSGPSADPLDFASDLAARQIQLPPNFAQVLDEIAYEECEAENTLKLVEQSDPTRALSELANEAYAHGCDWDRYVVPRIKRIEAGFAGQHSSAPAPENRV